MSKHQERLLKETAFHDAIAEKIEINGDLLQKLQNYDSPAAYSANRLPRLKSRLYQYLFLARIMNNVIFRRMRLKVRIPTPDSIYANMDKIDCLLLVHKKTLHLTAIPLRSIVAGPCRYFYCDCYLTYPSSAGGNAVPITGE